MKPMSKKNMDALLANGAAIEANPTFDPMPIARLYAPDADIVWLLCSIDPNDQDTAYGLVDLGVGRPELGFASLRAIADYRGRFATPVKVDPAFKPDLPISRLAMEAFRLGRISRAEEDSSAMMLHPPEAIRFPSSLSRTSVAQSSSGARPRSQIRPA